MGKAAKITWTWANCKACGQEMAPGNGCSIHTYDMPNGEKWKRVAWGREQRYQAPSENEACHDCNAMPGQYHHPGCDMEECPKCGNQLLMCDCWD